MHYLPRLALTFGLFALTLPASVINFTVSSLGANSFRYNYIVSGVTFQVNQELDIRFDPTLYGTLSNGVAPSGFSLAVFQPNIPPQAFGDYSALALVNNPSLSGTFSIDFTFLGGGTPGAQPFFINQFDANGNFVSRLEAGTTTPVASAIPEPGSLALSAAGLLLAGAIRRRSRART